MIDSIHVWHISGLLMMKIALLITIIIGFSGSLLAWRERPEPGATPLVLLLGGQCWWSITLLFRINATSIGDKILWVDLSWVGVVVIPVAWLFFSLEYAGYTRFSRPRYFLLTALLPVATILISLTNSNHHLLYTSSTLIPVSNQMTLIRTPGPWYWVIAGYTYLLGLFGVIPLLKFISSRFGIFRWQSIVILIGLFIPWATNILFLTGSIPTAGIDPTPIAFAVSGICYLGALTRFRLFGTSPTAIRKARSTIFNSIQEGAIILDRNENIVDMNREAASILEVDPAEVFGCPLEEIFPDGIGLGSQTNSSQKVWRTENGESAYDISINKVTDRYGRLIGQIITLHNISEHLRHQQRLEVLNRVFRHNIRTNTQIILGNADYLATHNSEAAAEKVRENAIEIEEIGNKIRLVLNIFEQGRKQTQLKNLSSIIQTHKSDIHEQFPEISISCNLEVENRHVDKIMDDVLLNILENAAQHNTAADPAIDIQVLAKENYAEIIVADNGPGIDEEELSIFRDRTETPLKHGSGFGLALIVWGTELVGGNVSFGENSPTGSIVSVEVPTYDRSKVAGDLSQKSDLDLHSINSG